MARYKYGQKWSPDFDYCGMLKAGMKAKGSDGPEKLMRLFRSYEDVNYHMEAKPLWTAIKQLEKSQTGKAWQNMEKFRRATKKKHQEVECGR